MIPTHELSGVRYGGAEASAMDEMAALLGGVFSGGDTVALALGVTPAEFEDLVRLFCPHLDGQRVALSALGIQPRKSGICPSIYREPCPLPRRKQNEIT